MNITKEVKIQPCLEIKGLSNDIFKVKVLYSAMAHFKGSNIDIYQVLKIFKIFKSYNLRKLIEFEMLFKGA